MTDRTIVLCDYNVTVTENSILFLTGLKNSKIVFGENGKLCFSSQAAFSEELQPNISQDLWSTIAQILEICDVLSDQFKEFFSKQQVLVASLNESLNESGDLVVEFASIKPLSEDEMTATINIFVP